MKKSATQVSTKTPVSVLLTFDIDPQTDNQFVVSNIDRPKAAVLWLFGNLTSFSLVLFFYILKLSTWMCGSVIQLNLTTQGHRVCVCTVIQVTSCLALG